MASSATAGSIFVAGRLGVFVTPHKAEKAGHSPQKSPQSYTDALQQQQKKK